VSFGRANSLFAAEPSLLIKQKYVYGYCTLKVCLFLLSSFIIQFLRVTLFSREF